MKGECIMKRSKTSKRKDKRIFRSTSSKTQSINVIPKLMRGGIRL